MSEPDRRPTAEELEELTTMVRRDPGSSAFIDLGEAYLALGRPREALQVGAKGLEHKPDNVPGRLMVSRALCALHEWKQAQAELLKIVKTDRNNRAGFLLLGEVLLRRGDNERALPVLQHAQNLDPANPGVLSLVRLARTGQPIDPPPPIPTPIEPKRGAMAPPSRGSQVIDDAPTRVGGEVLEALLRSEPASSGDSLRVPADLSTGDDTSQIATHVAADPMLGMRSSLPLPAAAPRPEPAPAPPRPQRPSAPPPPPGGPRAAPPPAAPAPAQQPQRPSAPPPAQQPPSVRPRVYSGEKPRDAARDDLRRSAEAGEQYLNNLLTAGLLDAPSINAPAIDFDLKADKRWGRSSARMFVFLFVVLFIGVGGGGYWYYSAEKQREADVLRHQADAVASMSTGSYAGFEKAKQDVDSALKRDGNNYYSIALFARAAGLQALLYGTEVGKVELAVGSAERKITKPEQEGFRDLLIARASVVLATLATIDEPKSRLADIQTALQDYASAHAEDGWIRWLQGRAMIAAGDRTGAVAAFKNAAELPDGPVVALTDRGDMLLDDGDAEEALALYEKAIQREPDHPLALLGRSLARTQRSADPESTMEDLKVKLSGDFGPRVNAYRDLTLAFANYVLGDFVTFGELLDKSLGVYEPRYLARVALGRIIQGRLSDAAETRAKIAWYGSSTPQQHPQVALVDAELMLAAGLPERAMETIGKVKGLRAQLVRGRALLDLNKPTEAYEELQAALEDAPEDIEVLAWHDAARMLAKAGKERQEASSALDKLARQATTKIVRHVHGYALVRTGSGDEGRRKLELAIDDIKPESPNALAYRTRLELARIAFVAGKLEEATELLDKSLEENPGYLPSQGLYGRILLAQGNPQAAAERLVQLAKSPEAADAETELAFAEAVVARRKVTNDEREQAREAVVRAKEKGAVAEELARVAELVDPALLEKFGLSVPKPGRGR